MQASRELLRCQSQSPLASWEVHVSFFTRNESLFPFINCRRRRRWWQLRSWSHLYCRLHPFCCQRCTGFWSRTQTRSHERIHRAGAGIIDRPNCQYILLTGRGDVPIVQATSSNQESELSKSGTWWSASIFTNPKFGSSSPRPKAHASPQQNAMTTSYQKTFIQKDIYTGSYLLSLRRRPFSCRLLYAAAYVSKISFHDGTFDGRRLLVLLWFGELHPPLLLPPLDEGAPKSGESSGCSKRVHSPSSSSYPYPTEAVVLIYGWQYMSP